MRVSAAQLRLLRPREVASPPAPGTSRNGAGQATGGRARDRHGVQIAWIMAACLAIAAHHAAVAVDAHLRPVGLDPLGPRDHRVRPGDRGRPVLEAVPDSLHDAVRALRRRPRALPVAVGRARGRAVRLRDGLPRRQPARRRAHLRGARRGIRLRGALRQQQVRARRGARQLGAAARRGRAVGVRAPPRRPPRPRPLPRRRGSAAATRGVALPRPLRPVAVVRRAAPAAAHGRLRRPDPVALVPARVVGRGRPVPRRRARQRSEPGQRGVRRVARRRALQALLREHDRPGRARHA